MLSSICHLDMITTLRQLDIMLPQQSITNKNNSTVKSNRHPRTIKKSISPYLDPCPRPKIPLSQYLPPPPLINPNFSPYHVYNDSMYVVPNEMNRWFAIPTFIGDFNRLAAIKRHCKNNEKNSEKLPRILMELKTLTNCVCKDNCHYKSHEPLENDIIFPIDLDTSATEEEFLKLAAKYQKQCMFRIIFRQLIHFRDIADTKNIRLCMNCNDCRRDLKLYEQMAMKNNNLDIGNMCRSQVSSLNCVNCCSCVGKMCGSTQHQSIDYEKILTDDLIGTCGGSFTKRCRKFVRSLDKYAKKMKEFISICPKLIWKYELRLWSELLFDQKYDKNVYDVPLTEYNGRNTLLMTSLLKNALIQLSGNPKYILASLPNAYELPMLQEWIKLRYGLKYSQLERNHALRVSQKQWDKLLREDVNVRVPTPFDISNSLCVHYGYRNRVKKCVSQMPNGFLKKKLTIFESLLSIFFSISTKFCYITPYR